MYNTIDKENGQFGLESVNGKGEKTIVFGLFSEILPLESETALIVKEPNSGKWNLLRFGRIEFETPADIIFAGKDGKFVFADLDEKGRVKRDSTLMSYDEVWDSLKIDSLNEICGPEPSNYGHIISDGKGGHYVDPEGNVVEVDKMQTLEEIYKEPASFLTLQTGEFKDENFVGAATVAVKNGIRADMEKQEEVTDEYVALTQDLIASVKEKTEKEFAKIEEMRLQEEKANEQKNQKVQAVERLLGDL